MIFDPSAANKVLKTSCYGQLKGLKALEYSRLRASGNPEKSQDRDFEKIPGSRDIQGSRRGLLVTSRHLVAVALTTCNRNSSTVASVVGFVK